MKITLLISIVICFNSFGQNEEFVELLKEIPRIKTPFQHECGEELNTINIENKFIPEGASILGKVNYDSKYHFIILTYSADIILPILTIYDDYGKIFKEKELLDLNSCSAEAESLKLSYRFKVTQNNSIILQLISPGKKTLVLKSHEIILDSLIKNNAQ